MKLNDMQIFLLVLLIPALYLCIVGAIATFNGYYYLQDEEIVKNYPDIPKAREIEFRRRNGLYTCSVYVPKKYRADYERRYGKTWK